MTHAGPNLDRSSVHHIISQSVAHNAVKLTKRQAMKIVLSPQFKNIITLCVFNA